VLPVQPTGPAGTWAERTARLTAPVSGTHDVYLVAAGGHQVAAVDWWTVRP
jgi:Carbohydrate binding module (family 6)